MTFTGPATSPDTVARTTTSLPEIARPTSRPPTLTEARAVPNAGSVSNASAQSVWIRMAGPPEGTQAPSPVGI